MRTSGRRGWEAVGRTQKGMRCQRASTHSPPSTRGRSLSSTQRAPPLPDDGGGHHQPAHAYLGRRTSYEHAQWRRAPLVSEEDDGKRKKKKGRAGGPDRDDRRSHSRLPLPHLRAPLTLRKVTTPILPSHPLINTFKRLSSRLGRVVPPGSARFPAGLPGLKHQKRADGGGWDCPLLAQMRRQTRPLTPPRPAASPAAPTPHATNAPGPIRAPCWTAAPPPRASVHKKEKA